MAQRLQAIYEGGLLRPLEPLRLAERRVVEVVVCDDDLAAAPLRFVPAEQFARYADDTVTLEQVRCSLAGIPGTLAEDFSAERNERT
jgi:predicted DNA-binding antitoxin AbrB/MazE fold protein